jgi:hypothetical protein
MSRRARGTREDGAALVELAILLPLLMALAFGIIEFGNAWGNKLKVETAARSGARVGSSLGADRMADYNILQNVKAAVTDIGVSNVTYVSVYKVTDPNGAVPAGCSGTNPSSQTGLCNVYTGAQLGSLTSSDFSGATCAANAPDHWWCPTTRQNVQHLGTDYVGVLIRANTNSITGFFGRLIGMQSSAVMRIEPA